MKRTRVPTTAILFLITGVLAPTYAQAPREQEKQPAPKQEQQAKPAQQQAKPAQPAQRAQQQAKPAQPAQRAQQQAKPAQPAQRAQQQAKPAQPAQRAQQQAKPAAQPAQRAQQQAKPAAQPARRAQEQAKPAQPAQRAQAQQAGRAQPAGSHGRIPDDKYRASFGSGHTFHVNRAEFAGESRRFQYGGFWFNMVNPWPVGWLYTDNVYINYMNGGYFLCDPIHPGVYLSINIG